jgi:RES domain-containing protein
MRVVYSADSEALAALEVLVHLTNVDQIPEYVCVETRIPERLVRAIGDFHPMPWNYSSIDLSIFRELGTRWLTERASAVLRVPSVVIPHESNYVINPEHEQFPMIENDPALPFLFDTRLATRNATPF